MKVVPSGDESPSVAEKERLLNYATQICFLADISSICNAFHYKYVPHLENIRIISTISLFCNGLAGGISGFTEWIWEGSWCWACSLGAWTLISPRYVLATLLHACFLLLKLQIERFSVLLCVINVYRCGKRVAQEIRFAEGVIPVMKNLFKGMEMSYGRVSATMTKLP